MKHLAAYSLLVLAGKKNPSKYPLPYHLPSLSLQSVHCWSLEYSNYIIKPRF